VVNIVGPIDLDKIASLQGQFGIPRLTGSKTATKTEKKPAEDDRPKGGSR
jgi:hypothetical protein